LNPFPVYHLLPENQTTWALEDSALEKLAVSVPKPTRFADLVDPDSGELKSFAYLLQENQISYHNKTKAKNIKQAKKTKFHLWQTQK